MDKMTRAQKSDLKDLEQQAKEGLKLWEMTVVTLPAGYRIVASVERPDGDMYDLGQRADGQYRLFRRFTDPWLVNSHGKAEVLSEMDLAGFGLSRAESQPDPELVDEEGSFSSLCKSNLIITS